MRTHPSQFPSIGRTRSKPAWIVTSNWEESNRYPLKNPSHGATEWSSVPKKWHTQKDHRLPTPQRPRHQGAQSPMKRKLSSTHGMATVVSPSTPTIDTTPHLSPYGDDINTALHHKGALRQVMATRGVVTRLAPPFQTKPNVSTAPSYGLTQLRKASSKLQIGWTTVEDMESLSILRNSASLRMMLNLQALKSQMTVKPCKKKYLRAMYDFPTPQSLRDIRSWFGLVSQVSYALSMANTMLPFRELLKAHNKFHWNPQLQSVFEKPKETIIDEIVKIFNKMKHTYLATDWSKTGIGYWLFPNPTELERHQILVWPCEPGIICAQYGQHDVTLPGTSESTQQVPLESATTGSIRKAERNNHR